jgi:hypothetical protein
MVGNPVRVTATWTARAAIVDSQLDPAERTHTFGHEPDGLLSIIGERGSDVKPVGSTQFPLLTFRRAASGITLGTSVAAFVMSDGRS